MGRKVRAIPREITDGCWYVVDVDTNQTDWHEFRRLVNKEKPSLEEQARFAQLKADDAHHPFRVFLQPYTADDYTKAWAASEFTDIKMNVSHKGGEAVAAMDTTTAMKRFQEEVVCKRVLKVEGYDGEEAKLEGGRIVKTGKVITPTDGATLVDFILHHAGDRERPVISDIFHAIKDMSHLESGLGEVSAGPSDSSGPAIEPSTGVALGAARTSIVKPLKTTPKETSRRKAK